MAEKVLSSINLSARASLLCTLVSLSSFGHLPSAKSHYHSQEGWKNKSSQWQGSKLLPIICKWRHSVHLHKHQIFDILKQPYLWSTLWRMPQPLNSEHAVAYFQQLSDTLNLKRSGPSPWTYRHLTVWYPDLVGNLAACGIQGRFDSELSDFLNSPCQDIAVNGILPSEWRWEWSFILMIIHQALISQSHWAVTVTSWMHHLHREQSAVMAKRVPTPNGCLISRWKPLYTKVNQWKFP